jgi:hypothetical protein
MMFSTILYTYLHPLCTIRRLQLSITFYYYYYAETSKYQENVIDWYYNIFLQSAVGFILDVLKERSQRWQ